MKAEEKFDPLNYDTNKIGRYHVEVFNEKKEKVDETWVNDFTRSMAYLEVSKKLKPHNTWDATRVANI